MSRQAGWLRLAELLVVVAVAIAVGVAYVVALLSGR